MKYQNAGDVIPEKLLKEIQKYAAGTLLYIPIGEEKKGWGEATGYRDQLQRRNLMIRNKYAHGVTVSELADEYYLSLDTIKRIIYSKKNVEHISYAPTLVSAVQYANVGMIEEWIQCYLLLTQKGFPMVDGFMNGEFLYFGVVKFPLRLIEFERNKMGENAAVIDRNEEAILLPPLLIEYKDGKFYCTVQSDLLAALNQRKVNAYPTIIVLQDHTDYKRFMKYYGTVLYFVDKV